MTEKVFHYLFDDGNSAEISAKDRLLFEKQNPNAKKANLYRNAEGNEVVRVAPEEGDTLVRRFSVDGQIDDSQSAYQNYLNERLDSLSSELNENDTWSPFTKDSGIKQDIANRYTEFLNENKEALGVVADIPAGLSLRDLRKTLQNVRTFDYTKDNKIDTTNAQEYVGKDGRKQYFADFNGNKVFVDENGRVLSPHEIDKADPNVRLGDRPEMASVFGIPNSYTDETVRFKNSLKTQEDGSIVFSNKAMLQGLSENAYTTQEKAYATQLLTDNALHQLKMAQMGVRDDEGANVLENLPYIGQAIKATDAKRAFELRKQYESGNISPEDKAFYLYMLAQATRANQTGATNLSTLGKGVVALLPFAAELTAGRGLAGVLGGNAIAGGNNIIKSIGTAKRLAGLSAAKKLPEKIARKAMSELYTVGVQTALGFGGIVSGVEERTRQGKEVKPGTNGLAVEENGKSQGTGEAVKNAVIDQAVEVFSERFGEYLTGGAGLLGKTSFARKLAQQYPNAVGKTAKILKGINENTAVGSRLFSHIQGVVPEFIEERVGGALRGALGVDNKDETSTWYGRMMEQAVFHSWDDFYIESLTLATPAVGGVAKNAINALRVKSAINKQFNEADKLAVLNGVSLDGKSLKDVLKQAAGGDAGAYEKAQEAMNAISQGSPNRKDVALWLFSQLSGIKTPTTQVSAEDALNNETNEKIIDEINKGETNINKVATDAKEEADEKRTEEINTQITNLRKMDNMEVFEGLARVVEIAKGSRLSPVEIFGALTNQGGGAIAPQAAMSAICKGYGVQGPDVIKTLSGAVRAFGGLEVGEVGDSLDKELASPIEGSSLSEMAAILSVYGYDTEDGEDLKRKLIQEADEVKKAAAESEARIKEEEERLRNNKWENIPIAGLNPNNFVIINGQPYLVTDKDASGVVMQDVKGGEIVIPSTMNGVRADKMPEGEEVKAKDTKEPEKFLVLPERVKGKTGNDFGSESFQKWLTDNGINVPKKQRQKYWNEFKKEVGELLWLEQAVRDDKIEEFVNRFQPQNKLLTDAKPNVFAQYKEAESTQKTQLGNAILSSIYEQILNQANLRKQLTYDPDYEKKEAFTKQYVKDISTPKRKQLLPAKNPNYRETMQQQAEEIERLKEAKDKSEKARSRKALDSLRAKAEATEQAVTDEERAQPRKVVVPRKLTFVEKVQKAMAKALNESEAFATFQDLAKSAADKLPQKGISQALDGKTPAEIITRLNKYIDKRNATIEDTRVKEQEVLAKTEEGKRAKKQAVYDKKIADAGKQVKWAEKLVEDVRSLFGDKQDTSDTKAQKVNVAPEREVKKIDVNQSETDGVEWQATTPDQSMTVKGKYVILDAGQVKNSSDQGYNQKYQHRNRETQTSKIQTATIAKNLRPEALLDNPSSDRGAPIINSEKMVLSGNGRDMALNVAMEYYPQNIEKYEEAVRDFAKVHGIEIPNGIKHPRLYRMLADGLNEEQTLEFTEKSNQGSGLSRNTAETAETSASLLRPLLKNINNQAELNDDTNSEFVYEAVAKLQLKGTLNPTNSKPTEATYKAIEDALINTLFTEGKDTGDARDTIAALIYNPEKYGLRMMSKALAVNASQLLGLGKYSIEAPLSLAIKLKTRAVNENKTVAQLAIETDFIDPIPPLAIDLLNELNRLNSFREMSAFVAEYAREARELKKFDDDIARGGGLGINLNETTPQDLMRSVINQVRHAEDPRHQLTFNGEIGELVDFEKESKDTSTPSQEAPKEPKIKLPEPQQKTQTAEAPKEPNIDSNIDYVAEYTKSMNPFVKARVKRSLDKAWEGGEQSTADVINSWAGNDDIEIIARQNKKGGTEYIAKDKTTNTEYALNKTTVDYARFRGIKITEGSVPQNTEAQAPASKVPPSTKRQSITDRLKDFKFRLAEKPADIVEQRKEIISLAQAVGKALNLKSINIEHVPAGALAYYDAQNKTIVISDDITVGEMKTSLAHEVSHVIYNWAKQEAKKGNVAPLEHFNTLIKDAPESLREKIRNVYGEMTDDEFRDELAAHLLENNGFEVSSLAKTAEEKSWLGKVWDAIKEMFSAFARKLNLKQETAKEYFDRIYNDITQGKEVIKNVTPVDYESLRYKKPLDTTNTSSVSTTNTTNRVASPLALSPEAGSGFATAVREIKKEAKNISGKEIKGISPKSIASNIYNAGVDSGKKVTTQEAIATYNALTNNAITTASAKGLIPKAIKYGADTQKAKDRKEVADVVGSFLGKQIRQGSPSALLSVAFAKAIEQGRVNGTKERLLKDIPTIVTDAINKITANMVVDNDTHRSVLQRQIKYVRNVHSQMLSMMGQIGNTKNKAEIVKFATSRLGLSTPELRSVINENSVDDIYNAFIAKPLAAIEAKYRRLIMPEAKRLAGGNVKEITLADGSTKKVRTGGILGSTQISTSQKPNAEKLLNWLYDKMEKGKEAPLWQQKSAQLIALAKKRGVVAQLSDLSALTTEDLDDFLYNGIDIVKNGMAEHIPGAATIVAQSKLDKQYVAQGLAVTREEASKEIAEEISAANPVSLGNDLATAGELSLIDKMRFVNATPLTKIRYLMKGKQGTVTEQCLYENLRIAQNKQMRVENTAREMIKAKLAELGIMEKDLPAIQNETYVITIGKQSIPFTKAEVMTLHAMMQDVDARDKILGNGFAPIRYRATLGAEEDAEKYLIKGEGDDINERYADMEDKVAQIVSTLSAKEKEFAEWATTTLAGYLGEEGNKATNEYLGYEAFDTSMPHISLRGAVYRNNKSDLLDDVTNFFDANGNAKYIENNKSMVERQAHHNPLLARDIFRVLEADAKNQSVIVGWLGTYRDVKNILRSGETSAALVKAIGADEIGKFNKLIDAMTLQTRNEPTDFMSKSVQWLAGKAAVNILGFRWTSVAKNRFPGMASLVADLMIQGVPMETAMKSYKHILNPRSMIAISQSRKDAITEMEENSPYLKTRFGTRSAEVQGQFYHSENSRMKELKAGTTKKQAMRDYRKRELVRIALSGMTAAEKANATDAFMALRASGYSAEKAAEYVEKAIRNTQNPMTPLEETAAYQWGRQGLQYGLFQFTGQPAVMHDWIMRNSYDAIKQYQQGNKKQAAKMAGIVLTTTLSTILISALINMANSAMQSGGDEDEKKVWSRFWKYFRGEAAENIINPLFGRNIITQLIDIWGAVADGKSVSSFTPDGGTPVASVVEDAVRVAADVPSLLRSDTEQYKQERTINNTVKLITVFGGLPYGGVEQAFRDIYGVTTGRAFGKKPPKEKAPVW